MLVICSSVNEWREMPLLLVGTLMIACVLVAAARVSMSTSAVPLAWDICPSIHFFVVGL